MFRQKAQKLGSFNTLITPTSPVQAPIPVQAPGSLSLLERRQLRQQQLGLSVSQPQLQPQSQPLGLSVSQPQLQPQPKDISKITPSSSPLPNLGAIYSIDKTKTLGDTSQFKEAYKATKGDKNYVLFVFKKLKGSESDSKEIKTFEKLVRENKCSSHAICPVQVGLFEGSIAIVTEFIEGTTLSNLISFLQEKTVPQEMTIPLVGGYKLGYLSGLQLFEKIIKSLQFIHDTWKFVHLDLKPDNIMISNDLSSVYIIDLGSGCFSTEIVEENCTDRFAAEAFVAPESVFPPEPKYWDYNKLSLPEKRREQFENWKKADVYSIGKVFDYLLNVIEFNCETQKTQLEHLIKMMTDDNYTQRPDSSQVLSELGNLKTTQCAGGLSQLARCFF